MHRDDGRSLGVRGSGCEPASACGQLAGPQRAHSAAPPRPARPPARRHPCPCVEGAALGAAREARAGWGGGRRCLRRSRPRRPPRRAARRRAHARTARCARRARTRASGAASWRCLSRGQGARRRAARGLARRRGRGRFRQTPRGRSRAGRTAGAARAHNARPWRASNVPPRRAARHPGVACWAARASSSSGRSASARCARQARCSRFPGRGTASSARPGGTRRSAERRDANSACRVRSTRILGSAESARRARPAHTPTRDRRNSARRRAARSLRRSCPPVCRRTCMTRSRQPRDVRSVPQALTSRSSARRSGPMPAFHALPGRTRTTGRHIARRVRQGRSIHTRASRARRRASRANPGHATMRRAPSIAGSAARCDLKRAATTCGRPRAYTRILTESTSA